MSLTPARLLSSLALLACLASLTPISAAADTNSAVDTRPPVQILAWQQPDLQKALDDAPANSVILFNPNEQLELSTPLKINKALTLRGLKAKLPPKLGKSPLVTVHAKGVTIEDFELQGNTESVEQTERAPLIYILAGDFVVRHGLVINSSRHGIYVAPEKETGDIYGGTIRDIVGRGNARCVVAVGDHGDQGLTVHNVLVENIRCYDSSLRGAVNLKDGNDNVIVRDIYSSNSVYGVDIQDHKKAGETNRNILVENVYAVKCRHAVRTNNRPLGHENLTVRNVTAVKCTIPLRISNTARVVIENIRVLDHELGEEPYPPIIVADCSSVAIRDVVIRHSEYEGPGLAVLDSSDVVIDGVNLEEPYGKLTSGVSYLLTTTNSLSGLQISHVTARNFKEGGIHLESKTPGGTVLDYIISGNLAAVVDKINGARKTVVNNFVPNP